MSISSTFDIHRERMIEEQLIPRNIQDKNVLEAMRKVPRHLFVADAMRSQAYGDFPLPIGNGQTISQPYIVALMTQSLGLRGHEKVLEIGTGSGYQAAVLSRLCDKVFTIERIAALVGRARKLFDRLHYYNIVTRIDDGTSGWLEEAPFDSILVAAGGPRIPEPLLEQLADPGRLVIPVGNQQHQELQVVEKSGGRAKVYTIEQVRFVDLIGTHGWNE